MAPLLRRLRVAMVLALVASALVASGSLASTATPPGLPLYQFASTGSGPLPWNATALAPELANTTMLGAAHSAVNAAEGVLAYRTAKSHVALFTQPTIGDPTFADLSTQVNAPTPGADPVPFFDPAGGVDVAYVDTVGGLVILSANDPTGAFWPRAHRLAAWHAEAVSDLSLATGVTFANGLPSVAPSPTGATLAARTVTGDVEVLSLAWPTGGTVPYVVSSADASSATGTGTTLSDPAVLAAATPGVVTTTSTGDLELLSATGSGANPWVAADVSKAVGGVKVAGPIATASSPTTIYVAALAASGAVDLFSVSLALLGGPGTTTTTTTTLATTTTLLTPLAVGQVGSPWSVTNLTANTPGAPPLAGSLFVAAGATSVTVAGQAANWGDLFAITGTGAPGAWSATDVSVTAGSAARTVANAVTGFATPTGLDLFAAGVASPPPEGVGVYAIPSAKWSQAVNDGWPILSETGGLGTTKTPWVGFTSASGVATSPDFLMGQNIYNAHRRVTWLSFWTVSGPEPGEQRNATTYFNHGFAAGAWVATQIDQYRGLGVGLKPDWVIFDPEGYPDNHSGLDAPAGATKATLATYATYWTSMLAGWAQGLDSVDPAINAAVYANQSEYRNYALAASPLPIFEAVAFSGGGPVAIPGASGSNVRGFIAFAAVCTPTTKLANEESTLTSPPWAGQFNTLQFNAGVYCPPAPTS